jgi:hypothetical protein
MDMQKLKKKLKCGSMFKFSINLILGLLIIAKIVTLIYTNLFTDDKTTYGVSFISSYAKSYGLDDKAVLESALKDYGFKKLRLVSYWSEIEKEKGSYDFSNLDWQISMAEKYNAKVSLSIGLRQPRWPECHYPSWVNQDSTDWYDELYKFVDLTVNRYKGSSAIESYQLENEFNLRVFGKCKDFNKDRLLEEISIVKKQDPDTKIIVSRSNNWVPWPDTYSSLADESAMSVYRRVYNTVGPDMYVTYPFPAWFYSYNAMIAKIAFNQDSIIHELQMEPWPKNGDSIMNTTLDEHDLTFDKDRAIENIDFANKVGLDEVYLWGIEYWIYRDQVLGDPSVAEAIKSRIR